MHRLDAILWKHEIDSLRTENKELKTFIREHVAHMRRPMHSSVVARWEYYHAHKESIALSLGKDANWRKVKHITDRMFMKEKERRSQANKDDLEITANLQGTPVGVGGDGGDVPG